MKKQIIYFLLLLMVSTTACNFLEEVSPNDINADGVISNAANAEAALLGLYSSLQQKAYYGGQYPLLADGLSDNSATGGYSYFSLDEIGKKQVTSANLIVQDLYISLYRTVANCNNLLIALPNVADLEATRKKEIEAQARAIRALAHFDALRFFGEHWKLSSENGVPIIQTIQKITDLSSRATVDATYTFIIDELKAALTGINATDDRVQYVNRNSINALLARVYLYKRDKPNAAAFATKVIDNQNFVLFAAAKYADVFNTRRTSESIFELSFDKQNRSDYNGLTYSRDEALRSEIFYMAAQSLNDFFVTRPNDVRATLLDFDSTRNDVTVIPDGRTQKYRGEETKDNPAYIIRLAEMYLIRAEANGLATGLADLNTIRTQRGLTELLPADVIGDAAFLNAVLDERRAELNFEGHRYFDLARTGKIKTVLGVDDFRGVLPIPAREIAANQGKMKQNPGY